MTTQQLEEILRQCERDLRDMGLVEEDLNPGQGNSVEKNRDGSIFPEKRAGLGRKIEPSPFFPEFPVPEKSFTTPVFRFIWLKLTKPLREQAQFYSKGLRY